MGEQPVTADPTWSVRRRYFPAVEGMRAIAVLCVLVGHVILSANIGGDLATFADWLAPFGVVIFFGISGFLLYRQFLAARFASERVGELAPAYLWRRAVRILPAYWVALALATWWIGWAETFGSHWWVYFGLLQTYDPSWIGGLPIAWSLCIEASFYLALPFVAWALASRGVGSGNRHGLRWELALIGGIALLSLAWRIVMGSRPSTSHLNVNLLGTATWFCSGMLLAVVEVAHPLSLEKLRRWLSRPLICWPAAIFFFALLVLGVHEDLGLPIKAVILLQTVFYGLAAALLLAPAIVGDSGRTVARFAANPVLVFIGTVSYGIYLWHYSMLGWLDGSSVVLDSPSPVLTLGVLATAATLALATASWYLVEKPLMKRAKSVKAFSRVKRGRLELAEAPEGEPAAAPPPTLAQPTEAGGPS
ncbi:MAG: acyltransferase [Solirubrobacterales bacterium]